MLNEIENQGWIKLHRRLLQNPICMKDADHFAVWVYILLNATHQPYDSLFGGKRITLESGQLLTGRISIGEKLKINQHKVDRILKTLESEQQIEQQKSNRNRLVTVLNWGKYQQSEQLNEQQLSNKRATAEQQLSTNKNTKNTKNIKNTKNRESEISISLKKDNSYSFSKFKEERDIILQDAIKKYPDKDCNKAINNFILKNEAKNYKYKNYKLAFFNWVREDRYGEYGLNNGIARVNGRPRLGIT